MLGARRVNRIQSLADELIGSGCKALAIPTDVTHSDQVKRLVDAAVQTYGYVDVMINNAGLMPHSPIERLKINDWNRMINVNIKGVTELDIAENVRKLYEMAIPADSFAQAVASAMSQPEEVDVNEILFRPTRQEL